MKKLLLFIFLFSFLSCYAQVSPFITTTWNQTCFYNDSCPTVSTGGSCGRAYTGCNATAMAMICKYYAWPTSTFGGVHCNTNAGSNCVDFNAINYNYSLMPNNVTAANAEVARLMYHLGVAADMMWSGTSSNSFFAPDVLKRYYKYSPRIKPTANFLYNTTAERIAAFKAELDSGRPILAKGGSHFYLIDGYNSSDQFHMNFGWSGTYNGYYDINAVTNGAGTFTPSNYIINIRPLMGDLETAVDTIDIAAFGSTNTPVEFSSALNWTANTLESWITLNLNSGTRGYFNQTDGSSFNATINNGPQRLGYIFITNANDTDTIVVRQAACPLTINPDSLSYTAAGGNQNVNVTYITGSSWSASTADTWLSVSPTSGSGNGSFTVTASVNSNTTTRLGSVVITAGVYHDTLIVQQEAAVSTAGFAQNELVDLLVSPNPTTNMLTLNIPEICDRILTIVDFSGKVTWQGRLTQSKQIDCSNFDSGLYFIHLDEKVIRFIKQ